MWKYRIFGNSQECAPKVAKKQRQRCSEWVSELRVVRGSVEAEAPPPPRTLGYRVIQN